MTDSNNENQGFMVTPKNLGFLLSLLTLLGILYSGMNQLSSTLAKIESIDKDYQAVSKELDSMESRINALNTRVLDLSISVNRLDERTTRIK